MEGVLLRSLMRIDPTLPAQQQLQQIEQILGTDINTKVDQLVTSIMNHTIEEAADFRIQRYRFEILKILLDNGANYSHYIHIPPGILYPLIRSAKPETFERFKRDAIAQLPSSAIYGISGLNDDVNDLISQYAMSEFCKVVLTEAKIRERRIPGLSDLRRANAASARKSRDERKLLQHKRRTVNYDEPDDKRRRTGPVNYDEPDGGGRRTRKQKGRTRRSKFQRSKLKHSAVGLKR